jgi:hypothetical protein
MRSLTVGVLLATAVAPLAAQEPWLASYYPYFLKGPNDQLSVVLHYQYAVAADYYDRVPFAKSVSFDGGINASGSRFLVARFKGPRVAPGWRFYAEAGAVRENRFGYFSLGNDTEEVDDVPDSPWFNRVRRSRYYARAEISRQIVGPLHVAVGGAVTRAEFGRLPGGSQFLDDFFVMPPCLPGPPCPPPPGDPSDSDLLGQVRLILDTRDNEFVPSRGVLLEVGAEAGSASSEYSGIYGVATAAIPPWEGAVVTGRVLARRLQADAPLDARYTLHAWERTVPLVGGPESHRAFVYGRYTGRQVLLGNLEFRQDILNFGDYGAFTGIAFLDGSVVQEHPDLESNTLRGGGGLGLAMRILRSTVLQFTWAVGGDGFQFAMGTGWAF